MENFANSATHTTQLPVTRVKKIFRLCSNCTNISTEAVHLLTFATERFIGLLAKVAYGQAVFDKRKTLQLKDLEFCVKNYEPFSFLDGTLDGWPEISGGKRGFGNGSSGVVTTGISERFFPLNADEKQEDLNVDINDSNEIFGFDDSLEESEPPLDDQIAEKLDSAVTAEKTEMVDVISEIQSPKQAVFGHYGYYLPMNSTVATLTQTANIEVGVDMKRNKQKEEEMEIDTSTQYDSLNRTGFEMATDTVEVPSNI
ncbi:Histone-like transcription factor (CBF/NF-Y) and archaeal histone family protein [Brugia pahangi]